MSLIKWVDAPIIEEFLGAKFDCPERFTDGNKRIYFYDGYIIQGGDTQNVLNVILGEKIYESKNRRNEFHFGTFEGKSLRYSISGELSNEEREFFYSNARMIMKERNYKVPGKELQNRVLGLLCEKGFGKSVDNYLKNYWGSERFRVF